MRSARVLAGALFVVAAAALAVVESVSPQQGGIGQAVALGGFGFAPVKAPKVVLVPRPSQEARRKVTLRPTAFDATRIDVVVNSGTAGVYDVQVVPRDKGVPPVTLPTPFTILLPEPASVDPGTGPVKIPVAILGSRFGTEKGRVTVGGRKAKVSRWQADRIEVVVPKKLKPGAHPVVVTNRAGASTAPVSFTVSSGSGGPSDRYFRYDVGSTHFEATVEEPIFFGASHNVTQDFLGIGAAAKPTGVPSLNLAVNHPALATPMPYDVEILPGATGTLTVTYAASGSVWTAGLGSDFRLTVTGYAGGVIEGTFGGTLTRLAGTGAATVTITDGAFRATLATTGQ